MSEADTVLAAVYAVINMIIPILIGIILSKLEVLTTTTRRVISDVNYYVFVPMYGLFFVMKAVDRSRTTEIGILLWSLVPNVIIGLIISFLTAWILRLDVRIRGAFSFINTYGNVVVMPQMISQTLCDKGGRYAWTPACKAGLVNGYTSIPLIFINICYWVTVLPFLQEEKRLFLEMKKVYLVALNYYNSIPEFIKDRANGFSHAVLIGSRNNATETEGNLLTPSEQPPKEKVETSPGKGVIRREREILDTASNLNVSFKKFVSATDDIFIQEFYQNEIQKDDFNERMAAYEEFEEKFLNKSENAQTKADLIREVLEPEKLMKLPAQESIFSFEFVKRRLLMSPPTMFSLLGLILGFIFPFKEWLWNPDRKPLPTFLTTCQTIGGMMSPISMFMLGTYMAQSALIAKDMTIKWKHVIFSNIIRNVLIPAVGLFWVLVVMKATDETTFKENPIIMFISYLNFIVPNGLVLIAVYVVADYFPREFAVFSIYMNFIAIPMMAIWMIVYLTIYDKMANIST